MAVKVFGWLNTDMMLSPEDLNNVDTKFELRGRSGIYRFYDDKGILLYIGHSKYLLNRLRDHLEKESTKKPFKKDVRKILLTFNYENVEKTVKNIVDDVEHLMIRTLRPVYNKKYYK